MKLEGEWVDPPYGWKYGFPKKYTPRSNQAYGDWLVEQGYPKEDVELAIRYSRWWFDDN